MIKRSQIVVFAMGISLLCVVFAPAAHASTITTYGFAAVTNNSGVADAVASQLFVDIFHSDNTAMFRFRNAGPVDSYIADIYLADSGLFGDYTIIDKDSYDGFDPTSGHSGVDFESPASPATLPGAPADFTVTSSFTSVEPPSFGIDNGVAEWVQVDFDLLAGKGLDDIFDALTLSDSLNTLRIGIYVEGIDGFSDSFVNVTSSQSQSVPEPATLVLMGIGFGFLIRRSRKK